MPKIVFTALSGLACCMLGAITLYSAGVGLIDPKLHRAAGFALALLVAIAAARSRRAASTHDERHPKTNLALDSLLILGGLWSIWSFYFVQSEMETALYDIKTSDALPALAGLIVFLELCRRLWGWGLFAVGTFGVVYLLFGQELPGILAHSGFSLKEVAEALWYNTNKGVFGSITNIVLSTVFIFILFGVLLEGFSPTFAAGIEATASSGGQIMPPIMGAAALVMADLTGVGYLNIIVAALLPAMFYYFSLFSAVTVEARRQGIEVQPMTMDDSITRVDLINSVLFIGPIVTVIASLLAGLSTSAAGFYAVLVLLSLCVVNPDVRREPARIGRSFIKGAESGATLLIAIAAIGILVGSLDSTGLGLKLANLIAAIRGDSLFSALIVAMAGALVLGMGMPTLPAYLIIILVMGPAIQALGVSMLTAHMFVFYYGVASSLTPPVAIAAYAAAPIAESNPLMTAFMSFRLGLAKFIIPFVFAFYPSILIIEHFSLLPFLWIVVRTCFCIWLFSSALSGFDQRKLTATEIIARIVSAFSMLVFDPVIHCLAIVSGIVLVYLDWNKEKENPESKGAAT